MPFFTDTSLAPKVYMGTTGISAVGFITTDTGRAGYTRKEATVTYELRGLAGTTAAGSATYWSTGAGDSYSAISARVSEAGSYNVTIVQRTDSFILA